MSALTFISNLLFKLRGVSDATIEDAETENVEWSVMKHNEALQRATASTEQGSLVNGKLRESIRRARTSAFADFEHSIGGRHGHHS